MSEYDHEPIRGLPGALPAGEAILWQGAPDWTVLAVSALHVQWVAGYFALLAAVALASGSPFGALLSTAGGGFVVALLAGFAWLVGRTTVYTLTNRRVVLRIGVALNTCVNLPLTSIGAANLAMRSGGFGDIVLVPSAQHRIGYAMLWPHARPWRLVAPQPMLRAIPDAASVAQLLAHACAAPAFVAPAEPVRGAVAALAEAAA